VHTQGQFKVPVPFDSLLLGSEFSRPLRLPAPGFIARASAWLAARMGGGVRLNPTGSSPSILAPFIAAAQAVHVAKPGCEPPLLEAGEDMTALGDATLCSPGGGPLSPAKRRALFAGHAARAGRVYDTEHVWTFQAYDQSMDYASFMLPVPLLRLDLVHVLDGQPMQLLLKDASRNMNVMCMEVWHRRMLAHHSNVRAVAV
jgi:Protein of unknown function (DUF1769)